ncbi:MAG: hypothetical protein ACQEUT_12915 [Bacillota bacterium]
MGIVRFSSYAPFAVHHLGGVLISMARKWNLRSIISSNLNLIGP